ncbi:MAG: 3-deoxy-D-manno-octulosonic acid transferase [Alphaproteobacteria bacterium]|nr:3-deoxy-D-manno-octulosonic acid transferase [Alphaproteobacteria bacterium]
MMYSLYRVLTQNSTPFLLRLLDKRCANGKEDPARVDEKKGLTALPRPAGRLLWVHAASVGESRAALILIKKLAADDPALHILVTTVTRTAAQIMERELPSCAFHQYAPLDHPEWVETFLDHWCPDGALWMESELWPNMLAGLKAREVPAVLVNARLSEKSFFFWRLTAGPLCREMLGAFTKILAQTEREAERFRLLGGRGVSAPGNIKYSAAPLPFDKADLRKITTATKGRPLWLFASTHAGEEDMACRIHQILQNKLPGLLTIIVPRHPERRGAILEDCAPYHLTVSLRGENKILPQEEDDIYVADTLGELGLFYRLAPVACIGRSFSLDGGGGHNPIEAAQLGCAVLHGPNVQYLQDIFDEMDAAGASLRMAHESHMTGWLLDLLQEPERVKLLQDKGLAFCAGQTQVIDRILDEIRPIFDEALAGAA